MNYSWYTDTTLEKTPDSIHQTLAFGSLDDIRSLKKTVGGEALKKLFLEHPKKIYTSSMLYFIKNFILHITNSIDDQKYLKFTPRNTK
ncbi:MAG: hypothetical protein ACR2LN_00525 [Candidatus Levyibacteriota bacterium]